MAEIHLIGRAASPGLAIGPVTMLLRLWPGDGERDPAQEAAALRAAIEGGRAEIAEQIRRSGEGADILEFQVAMLEDDALAEAAYEVIRWGSLPTTPGVGTRCGNPGYREAEDEISVPGPPISSISATACSRI